jgi:hypothetical protein
MRQKRRHLSADKNIGWPAPQDGASGGGLSGEKERRMRKVILAATLAAALGGCTTMPEIAPIPGSITYGGQPSTKLTKAPVGSVFHHQLDDEYGKRAEETYIIQPDRSLRLVRRQQIIDPN